MKRARGFTLIESIVVIVVMAVAMITLTSFLYPQIARSADPHYQTRAAALGQSVVTKMLASKFDQQSDDLGGVERCTNLIAGNAKACTLADDLGPESGETPSNYNDIDDFIGCWTPNGVSGCKDLYTLVSSGEVSNYQNFNVDIEVAYAIVKSTQMVKQLSVTVSAGQQTPITFVGYRGNY